MDVAFWILGLLLMSRVATDVETQGNAPNRVLLFADDSADDKGNEKNSDSKEEVSSALGQSVADILRVLVKHETIIEQGAVVFSKPLVQNYSSLLIDAVEHADRKTGIYVGAMNWLIKFDLSLKEIAAANIPPTKSISNKGENHTAGEVGNFIKKVHVVDHLETPHLVVCGTNSSSPGCSWRLIDDPSVEINYFTGLFPASPTVGLASYMWKDEVVVGSALDPDGKKGTIVRGTMKHGSRVLRTMDVENWLDDAEFVGAFSISPGDEYVYVVFTEIAMEAPVQNKMFSRVARICKEDEGGHDDWHNNFGSFTKAHIHCMEFHKVTAISYIENSTYLWATFTSHNHKGSAVCNFEISKLESVFRGPFSIKEEDSNGYVPCPPPYIFKEGKVVETCFGLRSEKAVKDYVLMYQPISGSCVPTTFPDSTLSKIAVKIRNPASPSDVTVLVSDEFGQILKVEVESCIPVSMQTWEVIPKKRSASNKINELAVFNDSIIVLTNENVLKIPIKDYPGTIEKSTRFTATTTTSDKTTSTPGSPNAITDPRLNGNTDQAGPSHQSMEFSNKLLRLAMMICLAIPGF